MYTFSVKYNSSIANELMKNNIVRNLFFLYKTLAKLVPVVKKYKREMKGVNTMYWNKIEEYKVNLKVFIYILYKKINAFDILRKK